MIRRWVAYAIFGPICTHTRTLATRVAEEGSWSVNGAPHFEIGAATRNLQAKSKPEDHLSVVCFGASAGDIAVELGRIGKERALVKNGKVGSLTTGRAG